MDIVSRLKLFLSQNGISNSQFADTCDIPRPTLSQLLNGRNKKVSDELITKIHVAYPALNILWLMFGDGDMFVPKENNLNAVASPQLAENVKKMSNPHVAQENSSPLQTSISFGDNDAVYSPPAPASSSSDSATLSAALESIAKSVGRNGSVATTKTADSRRHIVNIMVIYSDNSFELFTPNNR